MKRIVPMCLAVAYCTAWTVYAMTDVGKVLPATEPLTWWLPFQILVMIGIPLLLGIEIGRASRDGGAQS